MRYLHAFGLKDNPFWPTSLAGVDERLTDNLITQPLRIDREPRLQPLYVEDAGPFKANMADFRQRLAEAGYDQAGQQTGQSLAVLVAGPHGTGKSTLANVMLRAVLDCVSPGRGKPVERFRCRRGQQDAVAEQVRQAAHHAATAFFPHVVVDVPLEALPPFADLFAELIEDRKVLLVIESNDLGVLDRREQWESRAGFLRYDTAYLTPRHAEAYVIGRLREFRHEDYEEWLASWDVFPFKPDGVAGVVPVGREGEEDAAGRMSLRQLNRLLTEALRRTAQELPEDHDIRCVARERVPDYAIDLKQVYAELVG